MSTFVTSSNVFSLCMVTQDFCLFWFLLLSVTTLMPIRQIGCIMICIPVNGGGKLRLAFIISIYYQVLLVLLRDAIQKALEAKCPGTTIIPIIISSNKTQLTLFCNKLAYPIYMTIGNIPKDVCRKPSHHTHILLGYLPMTKLDHITNKASRHRTLANLFHVCMSQILEPLETVGTDGLPMASGNGVIHQIHPILASQIGDYPEQVLVTSVKTGECPTCPVPCGSLGDSQDYDCHDLDEVLAALDSFETVDPHDYDNACRDAGIKPIHHPFWQDLPYLHIFCSITPDILHQLYQGVLKHLLKWVKSMFGVIEIDAHCHRLPPNHNIWLFIKGISSLSRVSGQEHNQICCILLRLIVGLLLPNDQ